MKHFLSLILIAVATVSYAQTDTTTSNIDSLKEDQSNQSEQNTSSNEIWVVESSAGTKIKGVLKGKGADGVTLETDFGDVTIPWEKISVFKRYDENAEAAEKEKQEKKVEQNVEPKVEKKEEKEKEKKLTRWRNEEWTHEVDMSRYFVSSSAFNMRAGQFRYQNSMIFEQAVEYGITDYFSLGIGMDLLSMIGNNQARFIILPKFSIPIKTNVKFGAEWINLNRFNRLEEDLYGRGMAYSYLTIGDKDKNASFGFGLLHRGDESTGFGIYQAGMKRMSNRFAIITENWMIFNNDDDFVIPIVSLGIRYIGEDFDLDASLVDFIPYVGVKYRFGKWDYYKHHK